MKARLLQDRPAYSKVGDRSITVKAGEIVEITQPEPMKAEYKGLYVLNLNHDQAEAI